MRQAGESEVVPFAIIAIPQSQVPIPRVLGFKNVVLVTFSHIAFICPWVGVAITQDKDYKKLNPTELSTSKPIDSGNTKWSQRGTVPADR